MRQEKIFESEINGIKESYTFNKVAKLANGSVLYRQGKAVLLATVVVERKKIDESFLPLTVQYIEKAYAAAKIPGGFIKRETKPGDFEVLTSRIIDRSLRPLFPKNFLYPVVISVFVLSSDESVDLQIAALHASNAALLSSDIPIKQSIGAVRYGKDEDGNIVENPPLKSLEDGGLDLLLVGSKDEILMIEMATQATEAKSSEDDSTPLSYQSANELSEDELIDIISKAKDSINQVSSYFEESFLSLKPKNSSIEIEDDKELDKLVEFLRPILQEKIESSLDGLSKQERADEFYLLEEFAKEEIEKGYNAPFDEKNIHLAIDALIKDKVREQIFEQKKRADGRGLKEVRPISIETNILPSVHGSCLFTRGETQALVTTTLGDSKDGQFYELLTDRAPRSERFMVHYNFLPFSVGEARPVTGVSRRELGHGNLAKRALEPVVDIKSNKTIRLVSEILESNGSSSMATVCGGSLALCGAEVEIKDLVAGVAMGLMTKDKECAILTDIMGLEDHYGDMDFKIAGTKKGLTALQLDIKTTGIDIPTLRDVLYQAKEAREHILNIMEEARANITPSASLPVSEHFSIEPSSIVHIIGKAGSTIKEIINRFGVSIDLDREKGSVKVTGKDRDSVQATKEYIADIVHKNKMLDNISYEINKKYTGKVKRVMDYGLFIEMPESNTALLHISKIDKDKRDDLSKHFKEGDSIEVIVLSQNGHKIELATPRFLESESEESNN